MTASEHEEKYAEAPPFTVVFSRFPERAELENLREVIYTNLRNGEYGVAYLLSAVVGDKELSELCLDADRAARSRSEYESWAARARGECEKAADRIRDYLAK